MKQQLLATALVLASAPAVAAGRSRGSGPGAGGSASPAARSTQSSNVDDAIERRRQSGQVTRLLRLFRAHGLIQKIPHTQRYQLTAQGRRILPTFPAARAASTKALSQIAA